MTNSQEKNSLEMNIGGRVKYLRESNKLNQTQFAEIIGVKQSFISKVEKNIASFTLDQIILLKNNFMFDINWLMVGEGEIRAQQPGIAADPAPIYLAEITPERKKRLKLLNMLDRIIDEGDLKKIKAVEAQLDLLDPGKKKQSSTHEDDGGGGYMGGSVA